MNNTTIEQYNSILKGLSARYESETDRAWEDDPIGFSKWIIQLSDKWASSTWRLRKNALIFCIENKAPIEALDLIKNHKLVERKKGEFPLSTSQKKAKRIRKEDFDLLITTLVNQDKTYDIAIANWLVSGLITGARPSEWFGAKLKGQSLTLPNGKYNEQRSCGKSRTIYLKDTLDTNVYDVIQSHIKLVNDFESKSLFDDFYESCRKRLYVVNKFIWPDKKKNICLYSTRHQFSANAKKGENCINVAALMGHRSSKTATEHYLRSQHGDPSMIHVEPDEKNIALVKDDVRTYADYIEKLKKKITTIE